mmetsp:Transcript_12008/g.31423  ORF Transcript_12008/g.31423 Transcript_12008/m.31423 type:complete len:205 (+) Transcript_12008:512-1126(+)
MVLERDVTKIVRDLPKLEHVLERVLHEQAGDNTHRRRQRRCAHALALERLLVDARGHDQRRSALEARELAWLDQLDVTGHRVLGHPRLDPHLPELVARAVDGHACLEVVDARQHEVDGAVAQGAMLDAAHEVLEVGHRRDVVVVRLELHVRVDEGERSACSLHLGQPALVGRVEEAIHVCQLHLVVVEENELAHATAHEHLSRD